VSFRRFRIKGSIDNDVFSHLKHKHNEEDRVMLSLKLWGNCPVRRIGVQTLSRNACTHLLYLLEIGQISAPTSGS